MSQKFTFQIECPSGHEGEIEIPASSKLLAREQLNRILNKNPNYCPVCLWLSEGIRTDRLEIKRTQPT